MTESPVRERNVAILMDFENTKDANLQRILSSAAGFGQVIIRRAYADWSRHASAQNRLREAGFEALHQFTTGAGTKNATDINLTVDAMDMLWSRPVEVFVLVTADSDFAKLAMRLREGGKQVVGIGSKGRVGRALVQACDQYIYYDEGASSKGTSRRRGRGGREKSPRSDKAEAPAAKPAASGGKSGRVEVGKLHMMVLNSFEPAADDDGWVYGSALHRSIKRLHPDFSYRDHGAGTFRAFIDGLAPVFESEADPARSDFLVWIADEYEEAAWAAVDAKDKQVNAEDLEDAPGGGGGLVLARDVQQRIDEAWRDAAGNRSRLQASKAGAIVAAEYGADRLADTPLHNLDAVLAAGPDLARAWKRERSTLVRR